LKFMIYYHWIKKLVILFTIFIVYNGGFINNIAVNRYGLLLI